MAFILSLEEPCVIVLALSLDFLIIKGATSRGTLRPNIFFTTILFLFWAWICGLRIEVRMEVWWNCMHYLCMWGGNLIAPCWLMQLWKLYVVVGWINFISHKQNQISNVVQFQLNVSRVIEQHVVDVSEGGWNNWPSDEAGGWLIFFFFFVIHQFNLLWTTLWCRGSVIYYVYLSI